VSTGFRRVRGRFKVTLSANEVTLIRTLMEQLLELMGELPPGDPGLAELGISENREAPDDPVLARLFPDGYAEDDESAVEFRRYTESSLRDGKHEAAEVVLQSVRSEGEITLDADGAQAWLRALNDIRLALGTRLEITEESYERMDEVDWEDPRYAMYSTYDWLTFLQESLIRALSLSSPRFMTDAARPIRGSWRCACGGRRRRTEPRAGRRRPGAIRRG
jgi:hypothetical protein